MACGRECFSLLLQTQLTSPVENIIQHQKMNLQLTIWALPVHLKIRFCWSFFFFFFFLFRGHLWMWGFEGFLDSSWCVGEDLCHLFAESGFVLWNYSVDSHVPSAPKLNYELGWLLKCRLWGIFAFHWNQPPFSFYVYFNGINKGKNTIWEAPCGYTTTMSHLVDSTSLHVDAKKMPRWCRPARCPRCVFGVKFNGWFFFELQPVRCCLGSFVFFFSLWIWGHVPQIPLKMIGDLLEVF